MDIWIGTSGYSFPDWVGPFYPSGLRPDKMLAHYARQFPLVELNFTFYRPPKPAMLERLAGKAPAGFQFLVKLPRTLSHDEKEDDLEGFKDSAESLQRRGCLMGLLCQLPQAHHYTRKRLAWLERLAERLGHLHLAVEYRHKSWARPEVIPWMAAHRLDLVAVDAPDLDSLYPRGLVRSSPRVYVRFHSRNAANWYLSGQERYDYSYDDQSLREWAAALAAAGDCREALLLFNNCMRGQAVENARRMEEIFRELAYGQVRVVPPPPASPPPRGLFDHLDSAES